MVGDPAMTMVRLYKLLRDKETLMKYVFMTAATASVLAVALICVFLLMNGIPAMSEIGLFRFLGGRVWAPEDVPPSFGILPMVMGSVYITAGAILVGVPIGILTAIYMAKFCPPSIYRFLKPATQLLAGIPSIVYGFFGLIVIVPLVRETFGERFGGNGQSIFTASILLGIMILPTIIGVSEAAIRAVPEHYYEGSTAMGATHERSVFFVVVPAAGSGIMTGIILGIGRAIGETMAVILVAGNQARMPAGMFRGVRTLTANIVMEMGYAAELHRGALIATGVVLFVFILLINVLFNLLKGRKTYQ
jgi:phosphate transport system permease protein